MLLTATGAVATGLSPAVRRCIDGTFAAGGGTVTEDGTTGAYKYAMTQADTDGVDIGFIFSAATAMPVCVNIVTTAADPTDSVRFGLTGLANAVPGATGGLFIAGTNAATTVTTSFTTTFTGNLTGNVGGSVNSVSTAVTLPTIPNNWIAAAGIASNALDGKGDWLLASSYTAPSNLSAAAIAAGVWRDAIAGDFTVANSVGKSVMNGVTLGTGLTVNAVTTGVTLAAAQKVDVDTIKTNPVVNGGTITFPTNATIAQVGDAMTLAAGQKVDVDTIKTNPVVNAGTVTFPTNATLTKAGDAMALTSGERNSVADALLDRDMSTGADSGSPTVRTVRQALRFLRNKWSVSTGTLTVTKEDDTTASWTSTLTTTHGADPVTGSDPA